MDAWRKGWTTSRPVGSGGSIGPDPYQLAWIVSDQPVLRLVAAALGLAPSSVGWIRGRPTSSQAEGSPDTDSASQRPSASVSKSDGEPPHGQPSRLRTILRRSCTGWCRCDAGPSGLRAAWLAIFPGAACGSFCLGQARDLARSPRTRCGWRTLPGGMSCCVP